MSMISRIFAQWTVRRNARLRASTPFRLHRTATVQTSHFAWSPRGINANTMIALQPLFRNATPLRRSSFIHSSMGALVTRRNLAYTTPLKVLGHFTRIPVALVTAGAGAITFAQYKVSEISDKIMPDWLTNAAHELGNSAKAFVEELKESDFPLPKIELPAFLTSLFSTKNTNHNASKNEDKENSDSKDEHPNPLAPTIAAAVAVASVTTEEPKQQSTKTTPPVPQNDDQLMLLTKKLIEVRNVLKNVDSDDMLQLPSIVVIGSQSSGKSSVLEAIVGHEFLPKGSNMVTRRPIELTLVHTPESNDEYGEFPQLGNQKVHDFTKVQSTLRDLNLAVPDSECVSAKPIELRIYSRNVPDLTMIDLPGYIQISNRNQPESLKENISELCEAYIKEPNIILAVCSADVDLANSEALRASRKVDPLGLRTIGVITKMDLVPPEQGAAVLRNTDYPLHLGYIGVVCRAPPGMNAVAKKNQNMTDALIQAEQLFFRVHPDYVQRGVNVGIKTLRLRLMGVLEESMGRSLHSVVTSVQSELDETRYQFKVVYNDRRVTAESYVAESMDTLKHRFKEFARQFGKPQVRQEVRSMLEQRVLDICAELYWADPRVQELSAKAASEDPYWQSKLDIASSNLTKSGVGRAATQLVVDALMQNMERLAGGEPFMHHPDTRRKILMFSSEILRNKFHTTVDQVENTIKPYKFEVECTEQEWQEGLRRAQALLDKELVKCDKAATNIKNTVGTHKLRAAIKYCIETDKDAARRKAILDENAAAAAATNAGKDKVLIDVPATNLETPSGATIADTPEPSTSLFAWIKKAIKREGDAPEIDTCDRDLAEAARPHYNPKLLEKAREALALRERSDILKARLAALRGRQCRTSDCQSACPEVYLNVVAEKLTYTAVMFIQVELWNEFFFMFPREVDNRLYYDLDKSQIAKFARENPQVEKHLALMERKRHLEDAMNKLMYLVRRQEDRKYT